MLTGQYPSRHGCFHVGTTLPENYTPTVAREFDKAGYFTGLLGKAHFQPCYVDENSFESSPNIHRHDFFKNWNGPYYGFEYAKLLIGHTSESHACGMNYGAWLKDNGIELEKYFGIHDYQHCGAWELPEEFHGAKWTADETINAINLAKDAGKPFFLWSSFQDPHNPYICPEPWASMYDPDEITLPDIEISDMSDKPPFYKSVVEGNFYGDDPDMQNKNWGDCKTLPELSQKDIRKIYAVYYGMISLMDHHIGRIIDYLEKQNLMESTIIVFTTDHGDQLGVQGLWGKGLPAFDDVQKVPFIVCHPNCKTPGEESNSIHSHIDLVPTFLESMNLNIPEECQGLSQLQSWLDANASSREWAMLEFRPAQNKFMQRTFVNDNYKLVLYKNKDYGELYDMINDPKQRKNLFHCDEHIKLRDELISLFDFSEYEKNEIVRERTAYA